MKIDAVVRAEFARQERIAASLKIEVDLDLLKRKLPSWHYESRVKGEESFALKVETGRVDSVSEVEDVFGATIVVPTAAELPRAEQLVTDRYELLERRPSNHALTSKRPDEFRFDDIRLYVRYRRTETERTAIPDRALFEVQVKTFLQHAWAAATHDLVYKTDQRDWRRERVAYQIRAALEQAEVAVGGIQAMATTDVLPSAHPPIDEVNKVIDSIRSEWDEVALPRDVRRLAEAVVQLLKAAEASAADLPAILVRGRERHAGAHSLDWSPYRSILNYVAEEHKAAFARRLRGTSRTKILLYPEVLPKVGLTSAQLRGAVLVGEAL